VNRYYELVLMLDPEAADEAREKVAGDVRQAIEGAGTLDRADVWGMRKMAYEINQRNEADYRFYRFQGQPQDHRRGPALPDLQGRSGGPGEPAARVRAPPPLRRGPGRSRATAPPQ
jgi:small subunit ribosomal protein S6